MPDLDIIDSTWICAPVGVVAAQVAQPANWRRWWPTLELAVVEWRGDKGVRWEVRPGRGATGGTMEIWLEPAFDGVVVHHFLRLDAVAGRPLRRRPRERLIHAHRARTKRAFWALGDQLDPGRLARGTAGRGVAAR